MDWSDLWVPLVGERLEVRPCRPEDAAGLAASADESTFAFSLGAPTALTAEAMARYLANRDAQIYTMVLRETGEIVGCSSFMDLRPSWRALEIGATWIAPRWRGTFVNPEAKLLMLEHGFERLGCLRVQLKCDARNERSAAAIRKLGAQFEGRLRHYGIMPDGYVRDTLMFSVIPEEWPGVRRGLEERLSRFV